MTSRTTLDPQPDLKVVQAFASLLERIEQRPAAVTAEQYRSVVQRLSQALAVMPPNPALEMILGAFPATATLYENLQYEHAGLCRAPLEASLNTEMRAREVIERARRRPQDAAAG